jgi:hypothetical protein
MSATSSTDRETWIRWLLNNDEEPSQLYEDLAAIMKADAETIAAKDAELAALRSEREKLSVQISKLTDENIRLRTTLGEKDPKPREIPPFLRPGFVQDMSDFPDDFILDD